MIGSWWAWLVHGGVNATIVTLAGLELWRLREWEGNWRDEGANQVRSFGPSTASDTNRLTARAGATALVAQLVIDLGKARSRALGVALLNEATAEFESHLGSTKAGSVGWRVCAASGLGWGCFWVMEDAASAATYLGSGLVGGLLTWNLGRMADSRARGLRARWNGLIRRLGGSFPQSETFGDRPLIMQCGADERG